ncbi:hypothetical protein OZ403_14380 [Myxococcus sp. NMCA1]|nr:hypothetical protein [Myxococcus sp. NMCA1]WAM30311.1 hypothetical protein OZ403_14380 [Myxococcus sp. NMCA1]
MCRALAVGPMALSYACGRLFGPALLSRLEALNAHPEPVLFTPLHRRLEAPARRLRILTRENASGLGRKPHSKWSA